MKKRITELCRKFPSPCGDYGSYRFRRELSKTSMIMTSFRPLAGIMVLIGTTLEDIVAREFTFPSPCGDYGSYLLQKGDYIEDLGEFPSPCGDYGSYHEVDQNKVEEIKKSFPSPCGDYGSYHNAWDAVQHIEH